MVVTLSEFALLFILLFGIGAFVISFIICFGDVMDYKER